MKRVVITGLGLITSIGDNVEGFSNGDRVAYPMDMGAYSEERTINANKLVKIPDAIDDDTAAAIMLKGLTAQYLLKRTFKVKSGDNILVYAAAGGVGLILSQWAKFLGANVIGCVGSEEKSEIAKSNGCDHVILYRNENIAERVRDITNGLGVDVAYDSVGNHVYISPTDVDDNGMFIVEFSIDTQLQTNYYQVAGLLGSHTLIVDPIGEYIYAAVDDLSDQDTQEPYNRSSFNIQKIKILPEGQYPINDF